MSSLIWPTRPAFLRRACMAVWTKAWERSLAAGDDHGWAANAADNAVRRFLARRKRTRQEPTP